MAATHIAQRARLILWSVLAALMVAAGGVHATSQTWYGTNGDHPCDNVNLQGPELIAMKGGGTGTGDVTIGPLGSSRPRSAHLISDEAAETTVDLSGTWAIHLDGRFEDPDDVVFVHVRIYTQAPGCGSSSYGTVTFTGHEMGTTKTADATGMVVEPGQTIGIQITMGGTSTGNATIDLTAATPGENSPTWFSSPERDPGFPLPEWGSFALVGVGLIGLAGAAVVQRRRA